MPDDSIRTILGTLTVIERKGGNITVLLTDDSTATYNEADFYKTFVEPLSKEQK